MVYFKRGVRAREARQQIQSVVEEVPGGADVSNLVAGYYRVRRDGHWRVSQWRPALGRWEAGGGYTWPPNYWHEIGEKVT